MNRTISKSHYRPSSLVNSLYEIQQLVSMYQGIWNDRYKKVNRVTIINSDWRWLVNVNTYYNFRNSWLNYFWFQRRIKLFKYHKWVRLVRYHLSSGAMLRRSSWFNRCMYNSLLSPARYARLLSFVATLIRTANKQRMTFNVYVICDTWL